MIAVGVRHVSAVWKRKHCLCTKVAPGRVLRYVKGGEVRVRPNFSFQKRTHQAITGPPKGPAAQDMI